MEPARLDQAIKPFDWLNEFLLNIKICRIIILNSIYFWFTTKITKRLLDKDPRMELFTEYLQASKPK